MGKKSMKIRIAQEDSKAKTKTETPVVTAEELSTKKAKNRKNAMDVVEEPKAKKTKTETPLACSEEPPKKTKNSKFATEVVEEPKAKKIKTETPSPAFEEQSTKKEKNKTSAEPASESTAKKAQKDSPAKVSATASTIKNKKEDKAASAHAEVPGEQVNHEIENEKANLNAPAKQNPAKDARKNNKMLRRAKQILEDSDSDAESDEDPPADADSEDGAPKPKQQQKQRPKSKNEPKNRVRKNKRGVIYIGHIPLGFFENQMNTFFSQFGKITRLKLSRSLKSARSHGYGFIEFKLQEVADVVARTMNGYMVDDRVLEVKRIPEEKVHPNMFKFSNLGPSNPLARKNFKKAKLNHNTKALFKEPKEALPEDKVFRSKTQSSRASRNAKRNKMRMLELGLDYDPKL